MACLEEHLALIIGQSLTCFLDHVIQGLANVPFPDASIQQLKDVICQVIALRTRGENLQQEILQVEGIGGKFYWVQRVVRNLKDVIFALEDIALPKIGVLLDVSAQMLDLKNDELAEMWLAISTNASAAIYIFQRGWRVDGAHARQ